MPIKIDPRLIIVYGVRIDSYFDVRGKWDKGFDLP